MDRQRTIWMLVVVLSVLMILSTIIKSVPMYNQWNRFQRRSAETQYGTDQYLEREIEFLENRLQARNEYQFELESVPMQLTNVLWLTDTQGRRLYRSRGKLRVSGVFLGSHDPQALINYKDENYTVIVGDSVDEYKVVWIDEEEVILTDENKEYHYPVAIPIDEEISLQDNSRSNN